MVNWNARLAEIGAAHGFYEEVGAEHKALFVDNGPTLVVTFDNLDDARQDEGERLPWGTNFAVSNGWSCLGMMAHGWTWYRSPEVIAFFERLRAERFFDRFERVVFYGVSMGGYGAAAYASSCPGATVIAMSPQATLDRRISGSYEPRFKLGWKRDFFGPYSYAPDGARSADRVYLFHDPLVPPDAGHAALFTGPNVVRIDCRGYGHGLASVLGGMGILGRLVRMIVDERASRSDLYGVMRARRMAPSFQKAMLGRLAERGRPALTYVYCRKVLALSAPRKRPHFAQAMRWAEAALAEAGRPLPPALS